MNSTSSTASTPTVVQRRPVERVSWLRLLWVAPLTVIVSVLVCLALRGIVQTVNPELARMPQLGEPMLTLAVEGAVAAVLVFALFTLFVPRAIFWFRVVAVAVLVISWIPDIMLGLGGAPMRLAMRYVGPLTSVGFIHGGQGGRPAGPPPGAQTGGPPPAFFSALPIQQVAVLMLLHAAVAVVCIGMLTTLSVQSRRRETARPA